MRMWMRQAVGLGCAAAVALGAAGCSATYASMDGERDAAAAGTYYMTVLVAAVNVPEGDEGPMETSLCRWVPVRKCFTAWQSMPLNSRLSTEQIHSILMQQGIQAVLTVTLLGDTEHPSLVGDDTDTIANGYGLSNLVGNANDPTRAADKGERNIPHGGRVATFSIRLKDADTLKNTYSGATTIKGKGFLYTKDDSFLFDASRTIAKEMTVRGFFRRKPPEEAASK